MKSVKKICAIMLLCISLLLSGCTKEDTADNTVYGMQLPLTILDNIVIENIYSYNGEFSEDGSFEYKENVPALKVTNKSAKPIQLLRICVTTDLKEMIFEITTLPVNMSVNVFEKNGQSLSENEEIKSITGSARADFENELSLMRDTFELNVHDKIINIKNISKTDIDSEIYLYYKKKDADGSYFGGITFRTKADGLKAGELKQLPASHFDLSDSEVLFIDYVD